MSSAKTLVEIFDAPSPEYKPWAFWYWINGNITREGLEADLEAMAEAGLGGVLLMHINEHEMIPAGPVRFLSDEYKQHLKFVFEKSAELGLQINLYSGEGWSVAGGPWITPELGMKELAWSEIHTKSRNDTIQFPAPHAPLDFYQEIATLAFPTPKAFIEPDFRNLVAAISVSGDGNDQVDTGAVIDDNWNTQLSPTFDKKTGETYIKLDLNEAYTFQNAFVKFAAYGMMGRNYLLVSDDGINYKEVAFAKRGQIYDDIACFQFDPVSSKHLKFVFKPTDNKLLYTAMPKVTVSVRDIALDNRSKTKDWCKKAAHSFPFFDPDTERATFPVNSSADVTVTLDEIVDVSAYLDKNGKLNWTPPSDNWTIIRFGMSSTEAINRPASLGGEGLEVDKLNSKALDTHFQGLLKEAKALAGEHLGSTFLSTHADSWEVGRQNWTQGFEKVFEERTGYSLINYLPATLGYTIANPDHTERFLWDMRKTIADLIAEEFYGGMRERANKMGIKFSTQSMKPFIDNLYALGHADIIYANNNFAGIPTEKNTRNQKNSYLTAKMTASAGSIYGRFVSSESFTALPEANRWLNNPQYYKHQADSDLAAGVTQTTHHLFTHQPWTTLQPGMTLNYWGVHFERTQTWWHEINTWNQYLSRSQAMMRQGQPVFDILHLLGDDSSTKSDRHFVDSLMPKGYDFEFISAHGLLDELFVNDAGKLAYKTGRKYSILSLAEDVSMRPEVLKKIVELLKGGATIVGTPPVNSPSLINGKKADLKVNKLVKTIWGKKYRDQVFSSIENALKAKNIHPDLELVGADSKTLWRHHYLADSNQDVYFITNVEEKASDFIARFRVVGKKPELWNALTGTRKQITHYKEVNGITEIALSLDPIQSYFIVFNDEPTTASKLNTQAAVIAKTIEGPWSVEFIKGVQQPEATIFEKLVDFKDHTNEDINYFSGTAKYTIDFEFNSDSKNAYSLDLGKVHQFARVRLNGVDLGVQMWPPYRFELNKILKDGLNKLEVEVTNLWPNRLIGDEREFGDTAKWKQNGYQGYQLVEFPDWLKGATPKQPGERYTFATWKHWSKDDALIPSGLVGPVTIFKQEKN